jgi:hypothetical protein
MAPARADMSAGNYLKSYLFSSLAYQDPGQTGLKPVRRRAPPAPPTQWPPQLTGRSEAGLRRCHRGMAPIRGTSRVLDGGCLEAGRPNSTRPPNGLKTVSLAVANRERINAVAIARLGALATPRHIICICARACILPPDDAHRTHAEKTTIKAACCRGSPHPLIGERLKGRISAAPSSYPMGILASASAEWFSGGGSSPAAPFAWLKAKT